MKRKLCAVIKFPCRVVLLDQARIGKRPSRHNEIIRCLISCHALSYSRVNYLLILHGIELAEIEFEISNMYADRFTFANRSQQRIGYQLSTRPPKYVSTLPFIYVPR